MTDKLSKLKNVFKKYGFCVSLKKIWQYIKANVFHRYSLKNSRDFHKNKEHYTKEITKILNQKYDRVIIWRSSFGWNVPLFQRPQHIMNNLSKNGCLVFYEVTTMTDRVNTISKINDCLYLVNFKNIQFTNLLMDKLKVCEKPKYIDFFSTDYTLSVSDVKNYEMDGFKIIYEYIDDLNPEISGTDSLPKNTIEKYNYMLNNNSIYVVASADILFNDIKKRRGSINLTYASNGVDYEFYQNIDNTYELEKDFLTALKKPTICYYGAFAKWFDYNLIKRISKLNKYNIILFGAKYDNSLDKSEIVKLENVYYFGTKDYSILKNYASKVDILMIPFKINDITKATSPVKLFEYMALHKPIVTTNMPECKKYESVLIAKTHDDFIEKLSQAYKKRKSKKYKNTLDKEARENDWAIKAQLIIDLIKKDEQ